LIVSDQEIARALELVCSASPDETADEPTVSGWPGAFLRTPTYLHHVHLRSLRQMLAQGLYRIPPDLLAEKMIGRAICDQTSRVFDGGQDRPPSAGR
jgi:hypothetical protein